MFDEFTQLPFFVLYLLYHRHCSSFLMRIFNFITRKSGSLFVGAIDFFCRAKDSNKRRKIGNCSKKWRQDGQRGDHHSLGMFGHWNQDGAHTGIVIWTGRMIPECKKPNYKLINRLGRFRLDPPKGNACGASPWLSTHAKARTVQTFAHVLWSLITCF